MCLTLFDDRVDTRQTFFIVVLMKIARRVAHFSSDMKGLPLRGELTRARPRQNRARREGHAAQSEEEAGH
jgi:hypothetical protein